MTNEVICRSPGHCHNFPRAWTSRQFAAVLGFATIGRGPGCRDILPRPRWTSRQYCGANVLTERGTVSVWFLFFRHKYTINSKKFRGQRRKVDFIYFFYCQKIFIKILSFLYHIIFES